MRKIILTAIGLMLISVLAHAQENFFDKADEFFGRYVDGTSVLYQEVKSNPELLDQLLAEISTSRSLEIADNRDKAFLINAYNLFVIKGVIDEYPIKSPQQVSAFFNNQKFEVAGKAVSLNGLEKDILLKQTEDARLHFVLVCGAKGCPRIINKAYTPETLDAQMDEQTRIALNDENFTRVDYTNKTVGLSQIFQWYRQEFLEGKGTILPFINKYRERNIGPEFKRSYYNYDWTLNDAAPSDAKQVVTKSTSNLLQFTPSQLFRKGQYEINIFNNLYSQTAVRNRVGDEVVSGVRASILTSSIQWTYGVSKNAKVNIGADIVLSSGSVGPAQGSNQFQLFSSTKTVSDIAVSAIGPRIKFQPIKKLSFLSTQSSFLVPVAQNLENRQPFLALNRYLWRNQFFYDFKLTDKFRLFYEFDINYYLRRNKTDHFFLPNFVDLPSSLFVTYFPNGKLSLFLSGQLSGRYGRTSLEEIDENGKFGLLQSYFQIGGGAKYQLTSELGIELSYGNFISGKGFEGFEVGAGEVVNFGIRYIK